MGDFYQNGIIANLHNLVNRPLEKLENELLGFSRSNPMALVLPSLYSELERPALALMVSALKNVPYLAEVVVGLDQADAEQFTHAQHYFAEMNQPTRILWHDGPRLRKIDRQLEALGLAPKELGKGRNVWYCYGYILASGKAKAVAMHDCDIKTYTRDMLARLIYPVANPNFRYVFCKGYYARVADQKLNGRVCRLLVSPLLRSLRTVIGPDPFIEYLDSFRYVLSGEFSLRTDVISNLRIPSDWGLEIGILSELFRNYSNRSICQVDIADIYDHKHQPLSPEDATKGLAKMSTDINKAIFRKLAIQGQVLSEEHFRAIKASYYRSALDYIGMYYDMAVLNGLKVDRHSEEEAVELFAATIMSAGREYLENPMATPFIPSWNRVLAAVPDILEQLYNAVELDHNEGPPVRAS